MYHTHLFMLPITMPAVVLVRANSHTKRPTEVLHMSDSLQDHVGAAAWENQALQPRLLCSAASVWLRFILQRPWGASIT